MPVMLLDIRRYQALDQHGGVGFIDQSCTGVVVAEAGHYVWDLFGDAPWFTRCVHEHGAGENELIDLEALAADAACPRP